MWKRFTIHEHERALVFVRGRLTEVLEPGVHRRWTFRRDVAIEVLSMLDVVVPASAMKNLELDRSPLVDRHFVRVSVPETSVAVVFSEGLLIRVFGPGEKALLWREPRTVEVREFNALARPAVPENLIAPLMRVGSAASRVHVVQVPENGVAMAFAGGKHIAAVGPGMHAFWNVGAPIRTEVVELRRQVLDVNGQDVLTKDKVTVRVNIVADFRIADPAVALFAVRNAVEMLHRLLQLAVRRTLGARTLDELLQEKVDVDPAAADGIRKEMATVGVEVGSIALKDVILPGEIREICNQVVAAEKQAQANLIRRREETAATRSLLNTARLMEESPMLLRLKELETLEKLTDKVGNITVTGGFEGMLDKLLVPLRK